MIDGDIQLFKEENSELNGKYLKNGNLKTLEFTEEHNLDCKKQS